VSLSFARRRILGWSLLGVFATLGVAWLAQLDYAKKISTDVLDLIPDSERAPEIALVRELASQAEARGMFFVLTHADGSPAPAEAALRFAAALQRSAVFDQAIALADTGTRDQLGKELFAQRFTILFPTWLHARQAEFRGAGEDFEAWLATTTAQRLRDFLVTPEALAFQDLLPGDPLLLLPGAVARLKEGIALAPPAHSGLVWARLAVSPLSESGQEPAFAAIRQATAEVRAEFQGLAVSFTGVNRFAAASRARIEREVTWLNVVSLLAVLGVAVVFIRGVHRALHLVPVIALSVLGAWVAATMAFERLHVIVFVIGSLLTGVAIDYGFYLFMQPPARPDEDYSEKVRRLIKPLLASCFTTVTGFALLLFSDLPMIRQLGVFVGAGLLCALGAAIVYFGTVRNSFLAARTFPGAPTLTPSSRRRVRHLVGALWLVALAGLTRLSWRDDIRELEVPSSEINREDARIRALFGDQPGRTIYLTRGESIGAAREALGKFENWLARSADDRAAQFANLGAVVPLPEDHAQALQFWRDHPGFAEKLRAALDAGGFDAAEFAPFFETWKERAASGKSSDFETAVLALRARLVGPQAFLLHLGERLNWFVTIVSQAPTGAPPPETNTVSASQLQSLNQLFGRYRESALWLSLVGLAIVGLGVLLTYGVRDGVRIFAIPCGACLGIFGLFGWLGYPLNLFHLLGAFLGVCLTHNYSIFSATSAYRREPPPVSVRLSALTTAASFGVLALSGIPVVRALGVTVASMVIAALLVIELEHLRPLASKP
jgi:predicted exporter